MTGQETPVQRLAGNAGWLVMQIGGARLLGFLLNIMLVRYLGAAGYGELSFALAFAGVFTILGDFGLSSYTLRELSSDKASGPGLLGLSAGIKLALSAGIAAAMVLVTYAAGMAWPERLWVLLAGAYYLFLQGGALAGVVFRSQEKMRLVFFSESAHVLLLLALCAACVMAGLGITAITSAYAGAAALYAAGALTAAFRLVRPRFSAVLSDYAGVLRASVPYGLSSAALLVYYNADILMLSYFKGAAEVGVYSVAYKLYLSLGVIASVYMGAAFPLIARLSRNSAGGVKRAYDKSFKFMLVISVPVSFIAVLLSGEIVTTLYGRAFDSSAPTFAVLSSVCAVTYLNIFLAHFFTATGRIRDSLRMFSSACLLNILLNLVLVPFYGGLGAAVSTVISEAVFFLLAAEYFSRTEFRSIPWGAIARLAIFVASLCAAVLLLKLSVYAAAAAAAALYPVLVLFGGVLDAEDRALIREALRL